MRARIARPTRAPGQQSYPSSFTDFFGRRCPAVFKGLDIHFGGIRAQLSLARYDAVPRAADGSTFRNLLLPRCWREKPTGTTDVMGRMRWDMPSLTIRTEFFKPEKGAVPAPTVGGASGRRVNRVITHYEAACPGLPGGLLWVGSKIAIARQIGNAVPSGLARAIAAAL